MVEAPYLEAKEVEIDADHRQQIEAETAQAAQMELPEDDDF